MDPPQTLSLDYRLHIEWHATFSGAVPLGRSFNHYIIIL